MKEKSIGLIELSSVAAGFEVADTMLKAGNVRLLLARSICSGKYMVLIGGDSAAVEAAGMAEELWHLPTLEEAPPDGGWFSYSPMGSFSTFTAATLEDPSGDAADAGDEDG